VVCGSYTSWFRRHPQFHEALHIRHVEGAENAGRENDGLKMQDMKMQE